VVALYADAKLATLRSGDNVRQTLERIGRVYGWDDCPIADITDDDAAEMLADIAVTRGKKAMANQAKHILHAMWKWAKQPGRKFVTVNPFADLPAPGGPKVERDRFLSADEIRTVWRGLDDPRCNVSPDAATALRLILVTAAREPQAMQRPRRAVRHQLHGGPGHWRIPRRRGRIALVATSALRPASDSL